MTETKPVKPVTNRRTRNPHTVLIAQFPHQIVQRQIALTGQPGVSPAVKRPELAPAAIALLSGCQRSSLALQNDHIIDELDRNPEMRRNTTMRVSLLDKRYNARSQLKWMWFTHL
jgi:hypothetical protein